MSKALEAENKFVNFLALKLPDYTIFREWNEQGLNASFGVQIATNYLNLGTTTSNSKKIAYEITMNIFREYSVIGSLSTKEDEKEILRTSIETIINSANIELPPGQSIIIFDDRNQGDKVIAAIFNIIYQ